MFNLFERKVAFRYFRSKGERLTTLFSGFSIIGICLGVATLIIVMSVMNGFRDELTKEILGFNGHLRISSATSQTLQNPQEILKELKQVKGIASASPVIDNQAMVLKENFASGVMVQGIDSKDLEAKKGIVASIENGSLNGFDEGNNIIIGSRLAAKYQLRTGDSLTLVSPKGTTTAFGTVPKMRQFTVKGIFNVGMYLYDSSAVFMALKAAEKFFDLPGVTGIEIYLNKADEAPRKRKEIMNLLGLDYTITDWQMTNASYFNALQVERNVMFLILTLIIIIAAFNIISSLTMLVKDKKQDIAILRTLGATRGQVMRIFFLTGATSGFIGTTAGLILGVVFTLNIETIRQWIQALTHTQLFNAEIYYLSHLPAKMDSSEVVVVTAMALTLSFLATLIPAWRAARLDPVEALRHD